VMANLKLTTRGDLRLTQKYPKDLPDLFKGDQLVVFGRYSGAGEKGKAKVQLEGSLAGERRSFDYKIKLAGSRDHAFIPRLWSTRRVGYLLDEIRLRGESQELKDEVVQLARKYGIVTPYTSYLIVEDEVGREVPLARQSMGRRRGLSALPAEDAADPAAPASGGAGFGLETEALRRADEDAFAQLAKGETGDGAVAAARANAELKKATTAGASRSAFRESQYAADAGSKQIAQETRLIAGKSFYENGGEWIDSEAQGLVGVEAVEIEFGSERYFELLAESTEIAQWLSVAESLQVVIDGKLYKIVPSR
jgi:Ca-activated chloride channel family protein